VERPQQQTVPHRGARPRRRARRATARLV
jgi:hypothetical protein